MKNPKLIVKPFAKNGQKNVIPENYETSMDSNQATWDQGFGQITMLPVAAGGLPPKGQDFNGILNQISENIVYQSQGGRFKFSPEYAESIGGYPKGAILQSDDEKKEYQSLIDNNKVNFNTTSNISASWELVGSKYAIKTEVDLALLKKFDKENISGVLGNDSNKVPSLNLLTTEVGKLQPKGNYQPAGDYATNAALTNGLSGKLNKTGGVVNGSLTVESKSITVSSDNDFAGINLNRVNGGGVRISSLPTTSNSIATITSTDSSGAQTSSVTVPSGFGGLALNSYVDSECAKRIEKSKLLQSTGTETDNAMSQKATSAAIDDAIKKCESKMFAVGQSFTDMKSERFKEVTYTNDTDKPREVLVITRSSSNKEGQRASVYMSGKLVIQNIYNSLHFSPSISFIVPPRGTYSVIIDQEITYWWELK